MADNDFVTIDLGDDQSDTVSIDISDAPLSRDQQDVNQIRSQPIDYNEQAPDIDPYVGAKAPPVAETPREADKYMMDRYSLDGVEVRRAKPNLLGGKEGQTFISLSPDGMDIGTRQNLINQELIGKSKLLNVPGLGFDIDAVNAIDDRVKMLEENQKKHRSNYDQWVNNLVSEKPGQFAGDDGKLMSVKSRQQKAIQVVADGSRAIDEMMANGSFRSWAKKNKGIDITDKSIGDEAARDAAEEFLMSSPSTSEYIKDLFPRLWNGYTSIGPGASGSIGVALQAAGFKGLSRWFQDLAEGGDLAADQRIDPRRVGGSAKFGQSVSTGFGSIGSTLIPGLAVARGAKIAGASAKAAQLLTQGTVLGSAGALSAWDQYRDAKANGASDEDAEYAAGLAAITQAPLELISPVPKLINRLAGEATRQSARKIIYEGAIDGYREALTEAGQALSANAIAKSIYDRDRDLYQSLGESAGVGGITGFGFSVILGAALRGKARNLNLTPEERRKNEALANIEAKKQALVVDTQSTDVAKMMALSRRQDEIKAEMARNEQDGRIEANTVLQEELDSITNQIGSYDSGNIDSDSIVNDNLESDYIGNEVNQPRNFEDELKSLDEEFDAADESDTATLEDINRRRFQVMDRQARNKARESVDPQSQEPVTTPSERSRAQTMANIQSEGVPVNRPSVQQVQAVQKEVNKIIGTMSPGSTQQKRGAKVKTEIKRVINENIPFITGTGTKVISADDYNSQFGKKHQVDPQTYTAAIGQDGQLYLILPSVGEIVNRATQAENRAASRDAASDQAQRSVSKKLEEEIVHLGVLAAFKESNRNRGGSENTDLANSRKRYKAIADEIRRTNPNAVPELADVYFGDKTKNVDDMTLASETVRMVLQRLRTGQITEDVEAINRAEQETFSDSDRGVIASLKKAIMDALVAIRDSISRYLTPETSTPEMRRVVKEAEAILDRYGVVSGKENNVAPKDYSAAAPKEAKSTPQEDQKLDIKVTRKGVEGDYVADKEFLAEGSESYVYRDGDNVVKISEPYNDSSEETYRKRIDNALRIDKELGDGTLKHVGYYESGNGVKNPVFSQEYNGGTSATQEQIDKHLEDRGFTKSKNGEYVKTVNGEELVASDLDGDNVKVNPDGTTSVIDAGLYARPAQNETVQNKPKKQRAASARTKNKATNNEAEASSVVEDVQEGNQPTKQAPVDQVIVNDKKPITSEARKEPVKKTPVPRSVQVREKISNEAIDDMASAAEFLAPKKDKSGKEKISQVTKEGETFPYPLVSPWADPASITYTTTNATRELLKARDKLVENMKGGFDMFRASKDVANGTTYGMTIPEQFAFLNYANSTMYLWKDEFLNSRASETDKNTFLNEYIETSSAVENTLKDIASTAGLTLQFAKVMRSLGTPGGAAKMARDAIRGSAKYISDVIGAQFHEVASELRGARNKSLSTVMESGAIVASIKKALNAARANPDKLARDIRKNFAKKKTLKAREIMLQFAAGLYEQGSPKVDEMIVQQTVKSLLATGSPIKPQNIQKAINRALSGVAKDLKRENEETTKKAKTGTPALTKLSNILANDKTRMAFVKALETELTKETSVDEVDLNFGDVLKDMRDAGWSESLRNESIKEVAGMLNYKFEDLIGYMGEQRNAKSQEVKDHFKSILKGSGASDAKIDQFIQDIDTYLTEETLAKWEKALSLTIKDKLKPFANQKLKDISTQELFKNVKSIKDIASMSFSQTKSFKEAFIERVIDEIGLPEEQGAMLASLLEENLTTAILSAKNASLESAIKRAKAALAQKGYKSNKKGLEQTLTEMAFTGVISNMDVYEAFRRTHNFPKDFMPYSHDLENQLMAWGEKAMALPEGDARAREQQKMMQYFASQAPVSFMRDVLPSWWYMSLLTGVGTYAIVNPVSSIVNIMGNMAVWTMTNPKSAAPMMKGLLDMMLDKNSVASQNFSYVMETGYNPSGMEMKYPKLDVVENADTLKTNNPLSQFMLRVIRGVKIDKIPILKYGTKLGAGREISPRAMLRTLRAADTYFRAISAEIVSRRLGYEYDPNAFEAAKLQAQSEYANSTAKPEVKAREIMMRANEIYQAARIVNDKDRAIIEQDARESVFTQKPQGLLGEVSKLIEAMASKVTLRGFPLTSLVIPFTNVVANVWNSQMNYTPVGVVRAIHGSLTPGGNSFTQGRNDKALELGIKSIIGTALMGALMFKDEEEDKTKGWDFYGSGPSDPDEFKVWRESGGKPYTIRVGTKYYPYNYTPLAIAISVAADFRETKKALAKKEKDMSAADIAMRIPWTVAVVGITSTMDQGFLTGLSDLFEAFNGRGDKTKKVQTFVSNIGSRFLVPGFVRDVNGLTTDKKYQASNLAAGMLTEMPVINAMIGDTALNLFGDEITLKPLQAGPIPIANRLSTRLVSTQESSLAMQVLLKKNLAVGDWNKTARWNERAMTYEEKRAYVQTAGPLLKRFLEENSEEIAEMDHDEAQTILDNVLTDIRSGAKAEVAERFNLDYQGNPQ